jgi:hypothetical protein
MWLESGLPLFYPRLSVNALVAVDDGRRFGRLDAATDAFSGRSSCA